MTWSRFAAELGQGERTGRHQEKGHGHRRRQVYRLRPAKRARRRLHLAHAQERGDL